MNFSLSEHNCRAPFDADIDGVWIAYIDDSKHIFCLIDVSMRGAHKNIDKYSSGHRRYWRGLSTGSHDYVSHIIAVPSILRSDKMGGHADRSNGPRSVDMSSQSDVIEFQVLHNGE